MSALSAGLRGSTEFSTKPGPGLPMPRSLCASICVTSNGTESCPAAINSCQNCSAPSCVSKTLPGIFLFVSNPQFFSKNSLTFSACHGSCPAASGRMPTGAGSQQSARKKSRSMSSTLIRLSPGFVIAQSCMFLRIRPRHRAEFNAQTPPLTHTGRVYA